MRQCGVELLKPAWKTSCNSEWQVVIARVRLSDRLQRALGAAERYKELYEDLEERYRILEAREAMTYEDAEQLGRQNAELLGHGHDSQKVSYVDAVRREMAVTKAVSSPQARW